MSIDMVPVRRFIEKNYLGGGSLGGDDEALFTSGMIDSFGVLELIAFLEKTYGVAIDTQKHELKQFDTIHRIRQVVESLKKG